MLRPSWIAMLMAAVAFLFAAARINHGLVDSWLPSGPGLTSDESFNIDAGVFLVDAVMQHGPLLLTPSTARDVFGDARYLPDHPPLGRLWLGTAHEITNWMLPGSEACAYNVPAARLGSCAAFAVMVLLLSEFALRRNGHLAGCLVAALLIGMPHIIGHARIAALEAVTMLAWTAAMIPLLAWWTGESPPTTRQAFVSGVFWGLLLLTKVQGVLLPPIVIAWSIWRFRSRATRPLAAWLVTGAAVFVLGWPWLWLDPIRNVQRYLGRAPDRASLYCWYLGERFLDKDVPWHFPFVMTMASVPLTWLPAILAIRRRMVRDRVDQLLMLSIAGPLCVFAMPGTPAYDGTRLFSIVLPLLALLLARQPGALWSQSSAAHVDRSRAARGRVAGIVMLAVVAGLAAWNASSVTSLTQYGPLVGGNRGAAALGLESSYWSEGLTTEFWSQVDENSTVLVAPVSHQFQLSDFEALVPQVRARHITLVPFRYDPAQQKGQLLLIHRLADLRQSLRADPEGSRRLVTSLQNDVVLARLIDTSHATWTEHP